MSIWCLYGCMFIYTWSHTCLSQAPNLLNQQFTHTLLRGWILRDFLLNSHQPMTGVIIVLHECCYGYCSLCPHVTLSRMQCYWWRGCSMSLPVCLFVYFKTWHFACIPSMFVVLIELPNCPSQCKRNTVNPRFSPLSSINPPFELALVSKLIVYNKHPPLE